MEMEKITARIVERERIAKVMLKILDLCAVEGVSVDEMKTISDEFRRAAAAAIEEANKETKFAVANREEVYRRILSDYSFKNLWR